jgi:hypothetical protein
MTVQAVPQIESLRVLSLKPLHSGNQIRLRRFQEKVKTIPHQDIGVNPPTRLLSMLWPRVQFNLHHSTITNLLSCFPGLTPFLTPFRHLQ